MPKDEDVEAAYQKFIYIRDNHKKRQSNLFKSVFTSKLYDDVNVIYKEKWIPTDIDPKNPIVFLDIAIGTNKQIHRIEIELFQQKLPRTAENFLSLCLGNNNTESINFLYT